MNIHILRHFCRLFQFETSTKMLWVVEKKYIVISYVNPPLEGLLAEKYMSNNVVLQSVHDNKARFKPDFER